MRTRLERLPDGSDYAAIMHGPILLAAKTGTERLDGLVADDGRMAHTSPGPLPAAGRRADARGRRVDRSPRASSRAGDGRSRSARPAIIRPASARDLELVPFFRVHDSRYMMYWRVATPAAYERVVSGLRESERARLRLEARTLDRVVPGEQQREIDHGVRSEASTTGATHGRPFRDAAGLFGYELRRGTAAGPLQLLVTYFANERDRRFETSSTIGRWRPSLSTAASDRFTDVAYPIPPRSSPPTPTASGRPLRRPDRLACRRGLRRPADHAGVIVAAREAAQGRRVAVAFVPAAQITPLALL